LIAITYNAIDISLWPYVNKLLINSVTNSSPENVIANATPIAALLIFLTFLPGMVWRMTDYA